MKSVLLKAMSMFEIINVFEGFLLA